jgi:hypothetical protein
MATGSEHIEAFIRAFVRAQYRPRLLQKPGELSDILCHEIESKFDPRRMVAVPRGLGASAIIAALRSVSSTDTAYYLCAFGDSEPEGEYPLDLAVELVETNSAAMASVVPGALAFCKSELGQGAPGRGLSADRWLLVLDPTKSRAAHKLLTERKGSAW